MALFKVSYSSMTAHYGPSYIEAEDEYEAKRKFGNCFSDGERAICMTAREITPKQAAREMAARMRDEETA